MFKVIAPCAIRDGEKIVKRLKVGDEVSDIPKSEAERLVKACGLEPMDKKERATVIQPSRRGRPRKK